MPATLLSRANPVTSGGKAREGLDLVRAGLGIQINTEQRRRSNTSAKSFAESIRADSRFADETKRRFLCPNLLKIPLPLIEVTSFAARQSHSNEAVSSGINCYGRPNKSRR